MKMFELSKEDGYNYSTYQREHDRRVVETSSRL